MNKKLAFLGLLILLVFSCDLNKEIGEAVKNVNDTIDDIHYSIMFSDREIYYGDFGDLSNYQYVALFLNSHIEYLRDTGRDTVSNLEDVLERGFGDCDDFALGFLNIVYVQFGLKFNIVLVPSTQREIIEGGPAHHVYVEYDCVIYEPRSGLAVYPEVVGYKYYFDNIFNL